MKKNLLLMVILFALTASLLAQGQMSLSDFEQEIWRLTNAERSKYGLHSLSYDSGLASLARRHTSNMFEKGFFAHRDPWGDEVSGRKTKYYPELIVSNIGENIGKFTNSRMTFKPQEVVTGWMNSPTHRDNILDRSYTHLGVGVLVRGTEMIATQNFASPVVQLQSAIPKKLSTKKRYALRFEYMGSKASSSLGATLLYPDRKVAFKLSDDQEMVGAQPIAIKWLNDRTFELVVPFLAGKGNYKLCFGYNGGYFPEGIVLTAK